MKRVAVFILFLLPALAFSQSAEVRLRQFNLDSKLALEGYDPVSYFDQDPKEGKKEISLIHMGVTYYFSSPSNKDKFRTSPLKYEPAFGGWCAYAMGDTGEKVKVDPETFKIIDNKLFLFYNFWGNNTLKDWNKNEKTLLEKALKNWKNILDK